VHAHFSPDASFYVTWRVPELDTGPCVLWPEFARNTMSAIWGRTMARAFVAGLTIVIAPFDGSPRCAHNSIWLVLISQIFPLKVLAFVLLYDSLHSK
jgi:hypothetical protein